MKFEAIQELASGRQVDLRKQRATEQSLSVPFHAEASMMASYEVGAEKAVLCRALQVRFRSEVSSFVRHPYCILFEVGSYSTCMH